MSALLQRDHAWYCNARQQLAPLMARLWRTPSHSCCHCRSAELSNIKLRRSEKKVLPQGIVQVDNIGGVVHAGIACNATVPSVLPSLSGLLPARRSSTRSTTRLACASRS